jgi:hypothetical protein
MLTSYASTDLIKELEKRGHGGPPTDHEVKKHAIERPRVMKMLLKYYSKEDLLNEMNKRGTYGLSDDELYKELCRRSGHQHLWLMLCDKLRAIHTDTARSIIDQVFVPNFIPLTKFFRDMVTYVKVRYGWDTIYLRVFMTDPDPDLTEEENENNREKWLFHLRNQHGNNRLHDITCDVDDEEMTP